MRVALRSIQRHPGRTVEGQFERRVQRLEDARPPTGARSPSLSFVAFMAPSHSRSRRTRRPSAALFLYVGARRGLNYGLLWRVALVHGPVMLAGLCTSSSSSRQRPVVRPWRKTLASRCAWQKFGTRLRSQKTENDFPALNAVHGQCKGNAMGM